MLQVLRFTTYVVFVVFVRELVCGFLTISRADDRGYECFNREVSRYEAIHYHSIGDYKGWRLAKDMAKYRHGECF